MGEDDDGVDLGVESIDLIQVRAHHLDTGDGPLRDGVGQLHGVPLDDAVGSVVGGRRRCGRVHHTSIACAVADVGTSITPASMITRPAPGRGPWTKSRSRIG